MENLTFAEKKVLMERLFLEIPKVEWITLFDLEGYGIDLGPRVSPKNAPIYHMMRIEHENAFWELPLIYNRGEEV